MAQRDEKENLCKHCAAVQMKANRRRKILIIVQFEDGQQLGFLMYVDSSMLVLQRRVAERISYPLERLRFEFNDQVIDAFDTPASLGMQDNDIVWVYKIQLAPAKRTAIKKRPTLVRSYHS